MHLQERMDIFELLFEELQDTNSRLEKEALVNELKENYPELLEDWTMILETLDGRHPIGWTLEPQLNEECNIGTIKEMIGLCLSARDKTRGTTLLIEYELGYAARFLAPIVNRTLKLGIGKSLLGKDSLTPMLAKKYDGGPLQEEVYITEKLDGNRCLAYHDGEDWQFRSRNGKVMKVDFDMTGLDEAYIYDGEVMSSRQTALSRERYRAFIENHLFESSSASAQYLFNEASGLINSNDKNKNLVYNIFDIVLDIPYSIRRSLLDGLRPESVKVRIIPVWHIGKSERTVNRLLELVCKTGGEGVMLNLASKKYEHKRSGALLKYKQVQFMDMLVTDLFEGKGKYEGFCGGLNCTLTTDDGKEIYCEVGTGLSDAQREQWWDDPSEIVGKIIEVGYHELTQDRFALGSKNYSVRFPRLINVREDKTETSEY